MSESTPDQLAVLTLCTTEFEAAATAACLEEAGIEAFAATVSTAVLDKARGVPVSVRPSDLQRAREVLRERRPPPEDTDFGDGTALEPSLASGRRGMPLPARIAFIATVLVALLALVAMVILAL